MADTVYFKILGKDYDRNGNVILNIKDVISYNDSAEITKNGTYFEITLDISDNHKFRLIAENGYKFDNVTGDIQYYPSGYSSNKSDGSITKISNTELLLDVTTVIHNYDVLTQESIRALKFIPAIITSVDDTPSYPVLTLSKNLVDCTISPSVESVEIDGTPKVFTITPDTQKAFKIAPKITINSVDHDFNLVNDVYTLDFNTLGIDTDISGTINATALKYKDVTINAENMTFTPAPTKMFVGDDLAITATANDGYTFRIEPYIHFHDRNGHQVFFTKVTDYQYTLSLTVKESNMYIPSENIELSGVAIGETPILRKYGTIQVYNPSSSNMNNLSKARFQQNGTVDGVTYTDVDLGQYITQFKRIFVDVDTNNNADIYLGRHNTEVKAPVVNDDIVTVDCGNVTLTGENQNELDTKIYKIFLVLTCYGITPLDSVYMNKTINIKYQCNIITGYADIIISQVIENILLPIQKLRCKISQDLPYIINVEQLKNSVDDDVYNEPPKIILQKQNIFDGNGFDTYKQNTINNETGYFMIDRFVNHQINATENELNEIESLLKSGVIM